jgi:hypothetical protein
MNIVPTNGSFVPTGSPVYSTTLASSSIGWAPRSATIYPNVAVTAGTRYGIELSSATTGGCYGLAYSDSAPYPGGGESYSGDSGETFSVEANRSLKFTTTVSNRDPLPSANVPTGFTSCAGEWGVCTLGSPGVIAYGGAGKFVYQTASGVVPCTSASFGQDPAFGTLKSCYVAPGGGPSGSTQCAAEGGTCSFTGTHMVAFGQNGAFATRSVTGGTACDDAAFGDPIRNVVKACYLVN